jgi:hypothetical protein
MQLFICTEMIMHIITYVAAVGILLHEKKEKEMWVK